jgi:mannose-6-phosphate isomerase-like protein (cupin superfamily)
MKLTAFVASVFACACLASAASAGEGHPSRKGFVLQRDAGVTREEPGPHDGAGQTTGYHFFDDVPGVPFAFRKRALHAGSSIGPHEQHEDEVYYVLSGRGRMTIDGETFDVGPGDAVLTRPGSTHALEQDGSEDLVILIVYPQGPGAKDRTSLDPPSSAPAPRG